MKIQLGRRLNFRERRSGSVPSGIDASGLFCARHTTTSARAET